MESNRVLADGAFFQLIQFSKKPEHRMKVAERVLDKNFVLL